MEKIKKFLKRLPKSEREKLEEILQSIIRGDLSGLDIKKLAGHSKLYRIRVGNFRIVYQSTERGINLVTVDNRTEKTYRKI